MLVFGVDVKSKEVQSNTGATLTCIVNGVTQSLDAVVWKKDNVDITTLSDYSSNYVLSKGSVVGISQTTTLKVIDAGLTDTDYACVVTSDEHGERNKETSVKLATFGVTFDDISVTPKIDHVLTCSITGLSAPTKVSFKNPDKSVITDPSATDYVIDDGSSSFSGDIQEATLTLKSNILSSLTSPGTYTCVVKSITYPESPAYEYTATVTMLVFGVDEKNRAVQLNTGATLTCIVNGLTQSLDAVVWKKDNVDVTTLSDYSTNYVVTKGSVVGNSQTTTLKVIDAGLTDTDYVCVVTSVEHGETNNERSVKLETFDLVDIEDYYLSPRTIEVTFKGKYKPIIQWLIDGVAWTDTITDLAPSESAAWTSNTVTFKLTNSRTSFDTFTVQAELKFASSAEVVNTTKATVYKREMTSSLSGRPTIGPFDAGLPVTFTCAAVGEDNTKFAFAWVIGMKTIDADETSATFTDKVTEGSLNERTGVLTITENNEMYNGILKCVATWSDISASVDSEIDVKAVGARMDDYTFDTGSSEAVLSCVVWGDVPPFSVEWGDEDDAAVANVANKIIIAKTDEAPVYTHTLTIKKLTFGDQGLFTCKVVFTEGGDDKSLTTTVMKLSASFDPASPLFVHDNTVEFTCTYTGIEDPKNVEWYTGDEAVVGSLITDDDSAYSIVSGNFSPEHSTKSSVFTVNSPSVASSGDYTCKWVLSDGSQFHPIQTMTVTVRSLTMPATTTSLDGNIALTCTFVGLAYGDMKWYVDNVEIESDDKTVIDNTELISNTAEFTLRIYDVNPEENVGTYQCRMTFEDTDKITASSEVIVRKASVISALGDAVSKIIVSADVLTAKCLMEGDKVPDYVEWYAGSTKITFDGTKKFMNTNTKQLDESIKYFSNITLKAFEFADSDTYRCVFKFTDASEAKASVSVDFATVTNVECVSLDYSSTTDVTLTCTYYGKSAATGVTFSLPDSAKEVGTLGGFTAGADPTINAGSQDGTYTLSGVTNDMDGSYSCEFTIDNGATLSARQQLTARKTEITTSIGPLTLNQIVRSSVTLTCSVAGGAKEVKWYRNAIELASADFKKVSTPSNSNVLLSAIKLTIADGSAGTYTCKAIQYDDICNDEQEFPSADVILEVIAAVPTTQPLSATVLEGTNHELTAEFPNPFGGTTYEIVWSFEGEPLTGGYVYSNEAQIFDGNIANKNYASTITSSLSITKISKEAAGSYTSTIKWKKVYIKSDAAVLKVPHISVPPSTTNVVSGSDAVFTCAVTADTAATSINLHQSSDDAITGTPVPTTSGRTVTAIITLTGVTSTSKGSYYCKATWDVGTITSDPVYLSVLEMKSGEIETPVWGVHDRFAKFECKFDAMLMESDVDAYLDATSDRKVYANSDVSWTFSTDGSIWNPISDDKLRFVKNKPLIGRDGVQVNGLYLKGIAAADEGMAVKCTISYKDDATNHFIGGVVESIAIALKIASITSFSVSKEYPIAGDTITFTCVASGKEEPTFTFATYSNVFDESLFTELSIPPVTTSGTTYIAKYVTQTIFANPTGQQVTCMADYGVSKGKNRASVNVNTLYNCSAVPFKQLGGTAGTITATAGSGESAGSLTQSVECPADTATVKYSLAADTAIAGNTITCEKSIGKYTPMFLSPCELRRAFTSGFKEQLYSIFNGVKICDESAEEQFSKVTLNAILKAESELCGFYPHVPCLRATSEEDRCTLDTVKSGCYFDDTIDKTRIQMYVDFATPTFLITAKKAKMNWGKNIIRFWNCDSSRKRREASNQQSNETISQSGVINYSPQFLIAGTSAAACVMAIMVFLTFLVLYRRKKKAAISIEMTQHAAIVT